MPGRESTDGPTMTPTIVVCGKLKIYWSFFHSLLSFCISLFLSFPFSLFYFGTDLSCTMFLDTVTS